MESDVNMVIYGHYGGESWSVRPVGSGRLKVVLCLCFPQSDHIFNISFPATSEGQIESFEFVIGIDLSFCLHSGALFCVPHP